MERLILDFVATLVATGTPRLKQTARAQEKKRTSDLEEQLSRSTSRINEVSRSDLSRNTTTNIYTLEVLSRQTLPGGIQAMPGNLRVKFSGVEGLGSAKCALCASSCRRQRAVAPRRKAIRPFIRFGHTLYRPFIGEHLSSFVCSATPESHGSIVGAQPFVPKDLDFACGQRC